MDNKGYYKLLEVPENATDEQIKANYRKLCLKWHPDRWINNTDEEKKTAEDKFKQINEAYSVLSDKEKRQAYDSGIDGDWQNQNPGGFNPFDIFKKHFGGKNPFSDFFGGWDDAGDFHSTPIPRGEDVDVDITLTMEEANSGVSKNISYEIHEKCKECNGTGLGKDGKIETCPHCNGTGVYRATQRMGFTTVMTQTACPYCNGTGKTVKNPCKKCGGTGIGHETKTENIRMPVPVGIAPGETLLIKEFGEYPAGGEGVRGDLRIHVSIDMPKGYTFMNNMGGVQYNMEIPFYDALLGCEKEVVFPSGKRQKIKIGGNTKNGTVISHANEGMKLKDGRARSSFDIKVTYTIPTSLSKKQEDILKEFKKVTENGN